MANPAELCQEDVLVDKWPVVKDPVGRPPPPWADAEPAEVADAPNEGPNEEQ